jgi:hypothetical protein
MKQIAVPTVSLSCDFFWTIHHCSSVEIIKSRLHLLALWPDFIQLASVSQNSFQNCLGLAQLHLPFNNTTSKAGKLCMLENNLPWNKTCLFNYVLTYLSSQKSGFAFRPLHNCKLRQKSIVGNEIEERLSLCFFVTCSGALCPACRRTRIMWWWWYIAIHVFLMSGMCVYPKI